MQNIFHDTIVQTRPFVYLQKELYEIRYGEAYILFYNEVSPFQIENVMIFMLIMEEYLRGLFNYIFVA